MNYYSNVTCFRYTLEESGRWHVYSVSRVRQPTCKEFNLLNWPEVLEQPILQENAGIILEEPRPALLAGVHSLEFTVLTANAWKDFYWDMYNGWRPEL